MELSSSQHKEVFIVKIKGSVDAFTSEEATRYFQEQLDQQHFHLVADLSEVDFMSSAGLRVVLATLRESRRKGGDLRLAAAQPGVEKILVMSGFTRILEDYPDVLQAVASYA